MKITPAQEDFERWIKSIPPESDLVFLSKNKADLFTHLPFQIWTQAQVKDQGIALWTLNSRSWYGYALNSADYCILLPCETIEKLDENLRSELFQEQLRLDVPTILNGQWITSYFWSQLNFTEKIKVLQAWFVKNEITIYESMAFADLPQEVQSELCKFRYDKLLNRFPSFSGPNCFSAAASAVENSSSVSEIWMHAPELKRRLISNSYKTIQDAPRVGDILIFEKAANPIHAAYYLGHGLYFEKPGQDFYEPYRIAKFDEWTDSWPGSQLQIWRK